MLQQYFRIVRMSAGESSRAHVVDIDELACSMRRKLNYYCSPGETHATGASLCTIYKVPEHIREAERHAYEPIVLSIGPYHYGTPELQAMEKKKWSCLDYVLKLNPEKDLLDYLNAIAILENQVRNCYTEEVKMEKKLFLQMLLLDGCFILVSLYGTEGFVPPSQEVPVMSANCQDITEEDGIDKGINMGHTKNRQSMKENSMLEVESSKASSSKESTRDCKLKCKERMQSKDNSVKIGRWYTSFVAHDLLLLENQIPFYIVKRIYNFVAGREVTFPSLTDKIAKVIEGMLCYYPKAIRESDRPKDFHHLLHLCHMYFRPSQKQEEDRRFPQRNHYFHHFLQFGRKYLKLGHQLGDNKQNIPLKAHLECLQVDQQRWHRAVQYFDAGVEFKKKEFTVHNPHSLLDIKFSKGIMEIPCLSVDEHTSCLFRNFIALEQTCPQFGNDITAYIVFMSQLLSMPDDVTLIARQGIIVHHMRTDKEVAILFTKLSKDVIFDFSGNYFLKSIHEEMEAYYQSRLNRWMAWLMHNHFSNPWLGLAALAAAIMLLCTIVQTLVTVLLYMKQQEDNSSTPH
ncbi:UPF0481 protein [Ananas comosus]|uniref:UPF0481 protein n=1 Tax=Ananas comosus TaxID=4615 RepID=A0A199UJF9_ANACO|nr:UPF0481 protein [Ananas comosus]